MRTGLLSTVSALLVMTAVSASAQSYSETDDRFKPRIYGDTSVAGVIYSEGASAHLNNAQTVRAQHIRQSDVSPEEYNRLLQEAERVKAYRNRLGQTTSQTSVQNAPQTQYQPSYEVQQQPYEIQLFESAPVTAPQSSYANYGAVTESYSVGQSHTVVKNDTLYNLSKRYNVEINDIRSANNIVGNNISLGQQITIPTASYGYSQNATVTPSYSTESYSTTTGRYNGTVNRVVMPVTTELTNRDAIYAVLPKDTLYSIARQSCVGVNDLMAANASVDANALKPGQRLNVPTGHCLPQ